MKKKYLLILKIVQEIKMIIYKANKKFNNREKKVQFWNIRKQKIIKILVTNIIKN